MGAQQPLKGGISFQDVINQNPEGWAKEAPEFKSQVADQFFQKHVASQPGFSDEAPETQNEIRTAFNKQYGVGGVGLTEGFADDPLTQTVGAVQRFGDLATLGIPARAWDAATGGVGQTAEARDAMLSQYATDPGLYGDMYRLSQNPIVQGIGSLGGAFGATNQIAGNIAPGILGKIPFLNRLSPMAQQGIATAGAFSGGQNLGGVLQGQQTPQQAAVNTFLQTATGGLMGPGRLKNAAIQGAGGYLSDAGSSVAADVLAGAPVDFTRANQAGMQGAALGGGLGLAFGSGKPQAAQKQSRYRQNIPEQFDTGARRFEVGAPDVVMPRRLDRSIQAQVQKIQQRQSLNEQAGLQSKQASLDKVFQNLGELINNQSTPEAVRQAAQKAQGRIKGEYERLGSEKQQRFGKAPKFEKMHVTDKEKLSDLVSFVREMRAEGFNKEADVAMGKFTPETRAKVYDEVKRQEVEGKQQAKDQKAKEKQAAKSNEAYTKAENKNRQRELKQLKGSIESRAKDQKAKEKQQKKEAPPKQAKASKAQEPKQTQQGIIKQLTSAAKKGEEVLLEYEAEKFGETSSYRNKRVTPLSVGVTNDGNIKIRAVNGEGQIRTYLLNDKTSGSRVVSAVKTGEPSRFEMQGEGKNAKVIERATGKVIKQVPKAGVKSSVLREKLNNMENFMARIQNREAVSPQEILDMANQMEDPKLRTAYETMDTTQKRNNWEDKTGEPC